MASHDAFTKVPGRGWHCPPAERIAAYIDGHVNEQQRQAIERHLADCDYCLKSVAGAISDRNRLAPVTPAWLRQKAEEQARPAKSKYRRWAWALAPVLASLLLAVVLMKLPTRQGEMAPARTPVTSPAATSPQHGAQTGGAKAEATRSITSQSQPLQLLEPAGGTALARNHLRFAWRAVPDAASYRIRITTKEGALVWEGRSEQPHVRAPRNLKIAQGSYFAWVTAYLTDGRELESAPVYFRVQAKR